MIRKTIITAVTALALAPLLAAAPATPTTHEVRMVQVGQQYRFEPASVTIHPGDRIRFTNVSGGPHNVSFARVPAGRYEFFCMPHMAMGMRGAITVQ